MTEFQAFRVTQTKDLSQSLETLSLEDLPAGELLIEVSHSCLNYKDALSATGHKGVTRSFPHTPGVDAAGVVRASEVSQFKPGDAVLVTGFDLGMNTDGGWGQYIRVPAAWVLPMPAGLDALSAMMYGTAGLTAGLCVNKLLQMGAAPEHGEFLVTGATGGVGILALALLNHLGFKTVALTGKLEQNDLLVKAGASQIIDRSQLAEVSERPLLKERWAGAVDTVGGDILANLLKSMRHSASVACCGLVAGTELHTQVYPFILRNVNLLGIDSVEIDLAAKQAIWQKLATDWRLAELSAFCQIIRREELAIYVEKILQGKVVGRIVLQH